SSLPTVRASRWMPPAPGMIPTLISGWPKRAPSPATMMSACIASSQPPPSAKPLTAAITGFGQAAIVCHMRWLLSSRMSIGELSAIARRSAPAAKTRSPPVSTMQRTLSSSLSVTKCAVSACRSDWLSALRASGRLSRISAIPAWGRSTSTCSMVLSSGSADGGGQFRHDLEQVADQAVVGHLEDRRVRILVDRHDHLRILHARQVLDRARHAHRDVQLRGDDLAGLADLVVVRAVARI